MVCIWGLHFSVDLIIGYKKVTYLLGFGEGPFIDETGHFVVAFCFFMKRYLSAGTGLKLRL